ncbi:MAG: hypothetical protein ACXVKO_08975, partial [Bacteriovorax sp.]
MLKILFFLLALQGSGFAQTFNLARFSIGESRVHVELSDFLINTHHPDVSASWVSGQVQWIRDENNLLVPRALLKIMIKKNGANEALVHINYQNKSIIPVSKLDLVETQIYVDLFNPESALIFEGNTL